MGMYSYFEDEDIEVKDLEGLKSFLERWKKNFGDEGDKHGTPDLCLDIIKKNDKGEEYVSFVDWNDVKLISYWYTLDCLFFKCVAKYIEGSVTWEFENKDEAGWIEFSKGLCVLHIGQMNWSEHNPEELMRDDEIDKKTKDFLLVEDL